MNAALSQPYSDSDPLLRAQTKTNELLERLLDMTALIYSEMKRRKPSDE